MPRLFPLVLVAALAFPADSGAVKKFYKYDQFADDLVTAGSQISGAPTFVSPGFAGDEAFGQIFKPQPGEYPIKITGMDLYFAAPPKGDNVGTSATLELWFTENDGPIPDKAEPTFSIDTSELFDPISGGDGIILKGDTAIEIEFDWDDPSGHPPLMFSGNVIALVRFKNPGLSLETEWNQGSCTKAPAQNFCGCQPIGTISDSAITPGANIMHIVKGGCSFGAETWAFAESLGIKGDFVFRMTADVTNVCTPQCAGKACGNDGCSGSCGDCSGGQVCSQGQCIDGGTTGGCRSNCISKVCGADGCGGVCGICSGGSVCAQGQCIDAGGTTSGTTEPGPLSMSEISPTSGFEDEQTPVSIIGEGFVAGATVRIGGTALIAVETVGSGLISATVPKGLKPGFYTIIVANPDGNSSALTDGFEVLVRSANNNVAGGCAAAPASAPQGAVYLLMLVLSCLLWRRRLARFPHAATPVKDCIKPTRRS
jgi:hypothetical protein